MLRSPGEYFLKPSEVIRDHALASKLAPGRFAGTRTERVTPRRIIQKVSGGVGHC